MTPMAYLLHIISAIEHEIIAGKTQTRKRTLVLDAFLLVQPLEGLAGAEGMQRRAATKSRTA